MYLTPQSTFLLFAFATAGLAGKLQLFELELC